MQWLTQISTPIGVFLFTCTDSELLMEASGVQDFHFGSFSRELFRRGKIVSQINIFIKKKKKDRCSSWGFQRLLTENSCWTSWIFLRPWEHTHTFPVFFLTFATARFCSWPLFHPNSCSLLIVLKVHYSFVHSTDTHSLPAVSWGAREKMRTRVRVALSTLKPRLSIGWFWCFLVLALALLKEIKPTHFSVIWVLWNEEYSNYSKMKSSICHTHFNELFVI